MISSSTRVTVMPEFHEEKKQQLQSFIQPEQISSLPIDTHDQSSMPLKTLIRSLGKFVYTSLPNSPMTLFQESDTKSNNIQSKSKLTLVPGRHRRVYRVEIDETTSINPTIARINRSDWSRDESADNTTWPDVFVAKLTVYRSSKEVKRIL